MRRYLVTDSDADIMFPFGEENLDAGKVAGRRPVRFYRGSHRVFKQLEEDVVEVGRRVAQGQRNLSTLLICYL
mgnify:CR=1 FL=1